METVVRRDYYKKERKGGNIKPSIRGKKKWQGNQTRALNLQFSGGMTTARLSLEKGRWQALKVRRQEKRDGKRT